MEMEYSKKDIAKSPKAKSAEVELPEGYELYEKRNMWHIKWDGGQLMSVTQEEDNQWRKK